MMYYMCCENPPNCPLSGVQLGHVTYRVGGPAYDRIVSEFGEGVRGEGGEINRKALGTIVFADKVRTGFGTYISSLSLPPSLSLTHTHTHTLSPN